MLTSLTCSYKWVVYKVSWMNAAHIRHDKGESWVHAGVSWECKLYFSAYLF